MKSETIERVGSVILGSLVLTLISTVAFAGGGGGTSDIAGLTSTITTQATAVAKLMNIAAYVAGVGFALAGVLQFKAHKDNPQQTPLSKPIVLIIVAACLLFLPSVMDIAGQSVFGQGGKQSINYTPPSGQ